MPGLQPLQLPRQCLRLLGEQGIILQQKTHPFGQRNVQQQAGGRAHGGQQGIGQAESTDVAAFGFNIHRARWHQALELQAERAFKTFLRGLLRTGYFAQHRATVTGQSLQIDGLSSIARQRRQHAAFARTAGAAQHAQVQTAGKLLQIGEDLLAIRLVTVFQLMNRPADLSQYDRHGAGTLSTAPAVHQGTPGFWTILEKLFYMQRDIARHQHRPQSARCERRYLAIQGADSGSFFIAEHRTVDGARQVVIGELGRRADVDDLVKFGQLC